MTTGQLIFLLLILVVVLAIIGLPWLLGKRRARNRWDASEAYLTTIDALIRGRKQVALDALRRVAREESDNILAYLRLGDLVRTMGHPDKAHQIHAGLAARPIESSAIAAQVQESLLDDLAAEERWDEAIRLGEKIRSGDRKNRVALRNLAQAYQARGDWQKAFEVADEWDRAGLGGAVHRPIELRIAAARERLAATQTGEARKLLEEAMGMEGGDSQVGVMLGDVLAQEGEHEKAAEHWLAFAKSHPDQGAEVFERLERSYYEMGKFGDLLQVYEDLIQASPESAAAQVALADMHKRRGRPEEAIHVLQSLLGHEPSNREAHRLLIGCMLQAGQSDEAIQELDNLLRDLGTV